MTAPKTRRPPAGPPTSTALAVMQASDFGPQHMQVVRDAYCAGASDAEFMVLWLSAKSRGLDPIKRQIHFVCRWDDMRGKDVWASQVSIDGFRALAEGTHVYAGQDEPEIEYKPDGSIKLARVRVYRSDVFVNPHDPKSGLRPFVGRALFDEFKQTKRGGGLSYMWQKMPENQTSKCAEAAALRRAFPEPLSGLYVPEEMPEPGEPEAIPQAPPSPRAQGGPPVPTAAERAHTALQGATSIAEVETIYAQCGALPKLRGHCYRKILDFLPAVHGDPATLQEALERLAQRVRSDPLSPAAEEGRQKLLRDIALAMPQEPPAQPPAGPPAPQDAPP